MTREGTHRAGRRWGRWLLGLPALIIIAVAAYGAIVALVMNPPGNGTTSVTTVAGPHHTPKPTSTEEELPPLKVKPLKAGVDPKCFETKDGPLNKSCQEQVDKGTKFNVRYLTGQPAISKAHPPVDTAASRQEGRTSLAYHGLELCYLLGQDDTTVFSLIKRFTRFYHDHAGPVDEYKTFIVTDVATAEICPGRIPQFQALERKFSDAA